MVKVQSPAGGGGGGTVRPEELRLDVRASSACSCASRCEMLRVVACRGRRWGGMRIGRPVPAPLGTPTSLVAEDAGGREDGVGVGDGGRRNSSWWCA
jgi:hypothetical protein